MRCAFFHLVLDKLLLSINLPTVSLSYNLNITFPSFAQFRFISSHCLQIIAPLLRVLEKCSALNILHRDIKPENIFLVGTFTLISTFSMPI